MTCASLALGGGNCRVRAVFVLDRHAFMINSLRAIAWDFSRKEWTFIFRSSCLGSKGELIVLSFSLLTCL